MNKSVTKEMVSDDTSTDVIESDLIVRMNNNEELLKQVNLNSNSTAPSKQDGGGMES